MAETVQITLDRERFLALVQTLCLARWICATRRPEELPITLEREIRALEESILSQAAAVDCENILEFDHASGGFYPTHQFEDSSEAREAMERYEDDFFWSEIVRVLTKRDLDRKGEGEYEKAMERLREGERHPVEERYWCELYENGLKNFVLLRREPGE